MLVKKGFVPTGAVQTFTIPDGTSIIRAECWGATGGSIQLDVGDTGPPSGQPNNFTADDCGPLLPGQTRANCPGAQSDGGRGSNLSGYVAADLRVPRDADGLRTVSVLYVAVGDNGQDGEYANLVASVFAYPGNGGWPDGGDGGYGFVHTGVSTPINNVAQAQATGGGGGGGSTRVMWGNTVTQANTLLCAGAAGGTAGGKHAAYTTRIGTVDPYEEIDTLLAPAPPFVLPMTYFQGAGIGGVGGGGNSTDEGYNGGDGGHAVPGGSTSGGNYFDILANSVAPAKGATDAAGGAGGVAPPLGGGSAGAAGTSTIGGKGAESGSGLANISRHGGGGGGGGYFGGGGGAQTCHYTNPYGTQNGTGGGGGGGGGSNYIAPVAKGAGGTSNWAIPMQGVNVAGVAPPDAANLLGATPGPDGTGGWARFTYVVHPQTPNTLAYADGGGDIGENTDRTITFNFGHDVPGATMSGFDVMVSKDGGDSWYRLEHVESSVGSYVWEGGTLPAGTYLIGINTIDSEGHDNISSRFKGTGPGYGGNPVIGSGGMATGTMVIVPAPETPVVSVGVNVAGYTDAYGVAGVGVPISWTAPSGSPIQSMVSLVAADGTVINGPRTLGAGVLSTTLSWPTASGYTDDAYAEVTYRYDATSGFSDPGTAEIEVNTTPPAGSTSVVMEKDSDAGTVGFACARGVGDAAILDFSIFRREAGSTDWVRVLAHELLTDPVGTFLDHQLATDLTYTYKVRFYGTDGWIENTTGIVTGV